MNRNRAFSVLWYGVNLCLLISLFLLSWALLRAYSTHAYLQGFVEGIVPLEGSSLDKAEAILAWMGNPPARLSSSLHDLPGGYRNPVAFLHHAKSLKICGTSVSVFVSLADRTGLKARRLLLLNQDGETMHVVAEVLIDGRWVVADTSFRTLMRDVQGRLLSAEDLRAPRVFQEATRDIRGYDPSYRYEKTRHVRLSKIPVVGKVIRSSLDNLVPGWDGSPFLSLLMSRASLEWVVLAVILLAGSILARLALGRYATKYLGIPRVRLRDRIVRAWDAFVSFSV